jgi:hypothetical protein
METLKSRMKPIKSFHCQPLAKARTETFFVCSLLSMFNIFIALTILGIHGKTKSNRKVGTDNTENQRNWWWQQIDKRNWILALKPIWNMQHAEHLNMITQDIYV